ncbi:hypothetical protein DW913_00090 [Collinsella sp. AM42-18AC]|uniref:Spy0128 family protein n=1 Tax=Collinsella sp. AM42-18AC TaxID=2292321 RepID=UPI000E553C29|nr:FctA domain-containing protein [Collinsella sp. AM42-18AC]RHA86310.1 hypothetical protein DW913_00090 [Collinsella sp. AM42-18AC]
MKANSDKSKQSKKATRRVLAGVLCGASVLSLVLSLVMPPISQAIANDAQAAPTEKTVMGGGSSSESTDVENTNNGDTKKLNSGETEGGATEDAAAAGSTADSVEAKGAAQPSDAQLADDENNDENANAPATVSANDYTEVSNDVSEAFANGGKFRLTGSAYSDKQIDINKDTTIDLNGNMLCNRSGGLDSFFVVENGATLTIEDLSKKTNDLPRPVDTANTSAGQPARMEWERGSGSNNGTPESLTYYETKSTPNTNRLGTTETTYEHVVTGFGAIDAASESGSVKYVVNVEAGGILNLKGGMITTAANLSNDGHVIFSQGTVKIEGGYVTNGNGGGWGGGLCITGANASLEMTGGVVAGNKAAAGGGVFADNGATLNLAGGIISGNATYDKAINNGENTRDGGYGGGVYTKGAKVTISGSACITNNRVDARITDIDNLGNNGLLGGGGIACTHDGTLNLTGGFVTANYSYEAGGGVYAGFYDKDNDGEIEKITFKMTGGTIAGNVADNAEGGGLRVAGGDSAGTMATINASDTGRVYITNNKTNTGSTKGRGGDWGGGGVFIQKGGKLNIVRTLITNNKAGGWSGGIGACPTGETIVSHSNGAAVYDNADNVDQDGKKLEAYHYSAGGDNKKEDHDEKQYVTPLFQKSGHKDFFLVRNKEGADKIIAVVLGKMLGGGSAGWKGTCDGKEIEIDANGGAEAKYMFGLKAHPSDQAKIDAQAAATTIISGNYSYTHGGGIMTNGDLIVGEVTSLDVYPAIKVKANKVLMKDGKPQGLTGHGYKFKLLGKAADSAGEPYWNTDGSLNANGCEATSEVTVNESGEIVIDTAANYQSGNYDLYLVEVPINEEGTTFDKAIYKIHIKVGTTPVNATNLLGININRYEVDKSASTVSVKREGETGFTECKSPGFYNWSVDPKDNTISTVKIGNSSKPAFTNELAPYQTSGTWTPQVTKKVDGGEMKKFKFELYTMDGSEKTVLDTKSTADDSNNLQTVTFAEQKIGPLKVSDFNGGKATFTYYICECAADAGEGTSHKGYTNDTKTFKVVVTATDDGEGHLTCKPAYYEVDANGHENEQPTDNPTFTNTYSTSLPLSGMSGVTLTYLAGAAVLCAAAAWMHIRRKANAKGGERRE